MFNRQTWAYMAILFDKLVHRHDRLIALVMFWVLLRECSTAVGLIATYDPLSPVSA